MSARVCRATAHALLRTWHTWTALLHRRRSLAKQAIHLHTRELTTCSFSAWQRQVASVRAERQRIYVASKAVQRWAFRRLLAAFRVWKAATALAWRQEVAVGRALVCIARKRTRLAWDAWCATFLSFCAFSFFFFLLHFL